MKKTKSFFLILFLAVLVLTLYLNSSLKSNTYQSTDKQNSCTSCHTEMSGFSPAHSPDKVSCIACHLGNSHSFDKYQAHKDMVLVPGNLSNASETCAKCHKGIDFRVKNSMMNTMSGIVSVDKYLFNENDNLDSIFNIHHLKNESPSDTHLRNKCASCHIGNEKHYANPITEKSRGGGCTACHLNYDNKAKLAHKIYINSDKKKLPKIHPSLSLKVTDNHCFGCHSRSGRISTNYEGWHETIYRDTLYNESNYRILEDKRVFEKQVADVHHTKGLSCVDCHDSYDVMGDGQIHAHQEEAVNVSCKDCHLQFNETIADVKTIDFTELNLDEQRIVRIRNIDKVKQFVYGRTANKNLINVVKEKGSLILITKNTSKSITISKQDENCSRQAHKNITCSACHTAWAPQCITCHTEFESDMEGYDLLAKKSINGKWLEKGSDYLAEYPTLGVVKKEGEKTIKTFAPGMIMHLKKKDKDASVFHRLFAPVSAHTISAKGKNCTDCHNNSVALGYGRGKLTYKNNKWYFKPAYVNDEDGLPKDAWIGFLQNDTLKKATRTNARPFTLSEQKKILKVGSCLTCHKEKTKVVDLILSDFSKALNNRSDKCK